MAEKFGVWFEDTLIVGESRTGLIRMRSGVSLEEAKSLAENGLYTLALAKSKTALEQFLAKRSIPKGSITETVRQLSEKGLAYDPNQVKPIERAVYVSGGWRVSGNLLMAQINETTLVDSQLKILMDNGLMRLDPLSKSSFKIYVKKSGGAAKQESIEEQEGGLPRLMQSKLREIEDTMKMAAANMTDVDWDNAYNVDALVARIVSAYTDPGVKKAFSKMKKTGSYLSVF